jgi:multiple sugar transport system substrate-binding protein
MASSLSSCSDDDDRPLEFWNFYCPAPQQDPNIVAQSDWFQEEIDRWNASESRQIKPVFMTGDQMNQRMPVAFASGEGPDIFLISPGDYLRYSNGGVLHDLAPYMEDAAIEDYFPEALTTRRDGQAIGGLPMEQEPLALFYDPELLEDVGVAEGDLPRDWDELLDLASRITSGRTTGLVLDVDPGYYQNFTFYPWLWQTGGDVIDPDSQRSVFDTEQARSALDLFGRAVASGATPRTRPANGDIVSAFSSGFAAFWQSGVWERSGQEVRGDAAAAPTGQGDDQLSRRVGMVRQLRGPGPGSRCPLRGQCAGEHGRTLRPARGRLERSRQRKHARQAQRGRGADG